MPRILTNKQNLPEQIVRAVQYDTHKMSGTISATQLIDSPKVRILKKLHTYEEDVSEAIYALLGTALHHVLERANIDSVRKRAFILTAETIVRQADIIKEEDPDKASQLNRAAKYIFSLIPIFFPETEDRFIFERTMRLEMGEDVISGTFDLFDKQTGILYDYKLCSVYSYIYPESRDKWRYQTNIYAYMLEKEGFTVSQIRVVAVFRDWSQFGLLKSADYPPRQVMEIGIPIGNPNRKDFHWTDLVEQYIKDRLALHKRAENGDVMDCTGEDRWATADAYKLKTPGAKRSVKNFDTEVLAKTFLEENRHKYNGLFIEKVPGESKRCDRFCPVAQFCEQRKAEVAVLRDVKRVV